MENQIILTEHRLEAMRKLMENVKKEEHIAWDLVNALNDYIIILEEKLKNLKTGYQIGKGER